MKILLDTHFLIWTALDSPRLRDFPWLAKYHPWGISPVSLLELHFLGEVGRVHVEPAFFDAIVEDSRYIVDEPPLLNLVTAALPLEWTRDPFDRMLAAHSMMRRAPLCTVDRTLREHHTYLPKELRI